MKRLLFLLIISVVHVEAKTGAFVDLGTNYKLNLQPEHIDEQNQKYPKLFSVGYIVDFTRFFGMGLQSGYSQYSYEKLNINDQTYYAKVWSIDFLWNPLVLNIGNMRLISKLGASRFYSRYLINENELPGVHNLIPMRGVALELPLKESFKLALCYLSQFVKSQRPYRLEGRKIPRDKLQRVDIHLRYVFPSD